jgi:hypothetical protein
MGDELAVARLGEALFARRDDQVSLLLPGPVSTAFVSHSAIVKPFIRA